MFFAGKVYDRGLEVYSNSENWAYNLAVTICLSFNMHQPINLIFGNLFFFNLYSNDVWWKMGSSSVNDGQKQKEKGILQEILSDSASLYC